MMVITVVTTSMAQDWNGIIVPPSPGAGMVWEIQDVSDDFNYDAPASSFVDTLGGKWVNWYHNPWTGSAPTFWRRDHVFVEDGNFKIITSRPPGDSVNVDGQLLAKTYLGCATSTQQVQYPVFIEANVKIMNSVLASDVWLLSGDDTQEIDICEAYGSERWNNSYFSDERLHLSHHVFIRDPFQDWQPSDPGSFYTDGETVWREDYHRIGVYWEDPWNLKYYVDGELVRTRSGPDEIDPVYFTNAIDPGDPTNDTRTGLNKPMDIILNTEDQSWRALQGLTPTDDELANEEDNTFQIDWIRAYKPVPGVVGPVVGVTIDPDEVTTYVGDVFLLTANIDPYNANDLSVVWETDNPDVATVNAAGEVETHAEGTAQIIVTTNENNLKDTCLVSVSGQSPSISFDDESIYLNTEYQVGGELEVTCNFHAGTGRTVINGGSGGVKFWLREITSGWGVANDYVVSDPSAIGQESGTATGIISLENVPATAEIPEENWYFLYVTFENSEGEFIDLGTWPINIINPTSTFSEEKNNKLNLFPNPANDELHIFHKNLKSEFSLQIIDANGKLIDVSEINLNGSNMHLNISHLPKGFFVVKLIADKVYIASFVKQ